MKKIAFCILVLVEWVSMGRAQEEEKWGTITCQSKDGGFLWGFADLTKKTASQEDVFMIPCQYQNILPFSEGLAAVRNHDQWGYIDKKGSLVIPQKFFGASAFKNGQALVLESEGDNYHAFFVNRSGQARDEYFQTNAVPIPEIQPGNVLYVNAVPGLQLREQPGLNSNKMMLIAYQEPIQVIKDTNQSIAFEDQGIKGHWILVEYKGQNGYLFDGYLSRLPAPKPGSTLSDYFKSQFKAATQSIEVFVSNIYRIEFSQLENGITQEKITRGESEYTNSKTYHIQKFNLPKFSKKEAFLLLKNCYPAFLKEETFKDSLGVVFNDEQLKQPDRIRTLGESDGYENILEVSFHMDENQQKGVVLTVKTTTFESGD